MKLVKSHPSKQRIIVALIIFATTALVASLVRLSRPDFGVLPFLNALDFNGTSPNFFACFAFPVMASFIQKCIIDIFFYIKVVYGNAIGMTGYEFIQIYISARTFDTADIVASFVGATASLVFVILVFLMEYGNESQTEHGAAFDAASRRQ